MIFKADTLVYLTFTVDDDMIAKILKIDRLGFFGRLTLLDWGGSQWLVLIKSLKNEMKKYQKSDTSISIIILYAFLSVSLLLGKYWFNGDKIWHGPLQS